MDRRRFKFTVYFEYLRLMEINRLDGLSFYMKNVFKIESDIQGLYKLSICRVYIGGDNVIHKTN
jgi:hypothetical protein